MKKQIFTLLTLLVLCVTGAWADKVYYLQTPGAATPALTGDFFTTAPLTMDVTSSYNEVDYTKGLTFASNTTSYGTNFSYPDRVVRYDCKTSVTEIVVVAYNKHTSSSKKIYMMNIKENALGTAATVSSVTNFDVAKESTVASSKYTVENTRPSSVYFTVGDRSNCTIVQIIATEKGTAFPTPGTAGYTVNFNKGRFVVRSGNAATLDACATDSEAGLEIHANSNYQAGTNANVQIGSRGTNYIKFTTGAPLLLKLTTSSTSSYTVSTTKGSTTDPITPTANVAQSIPLAAAGTYYINPQGSSVNVTGLTFEAPDVTAPVLDKANSVPADGAENVPVAGTIVLKFNEAIETVDAEQYTLNNGGTVSSVAIDGTDNTKVNVAYTGLGYFANYTLTIAAGGYADASGNANASAETLSFKTMKETVANPVISPANGKTFSGATQAVTITCETASANIYYTLDGTTPTSSSTLYTGVFNISSTTTIKAIALKDGLEDSEVVTATITKVISNVINSWDFTNWSASKAGILADDANWDAIEKDGSTLDWSTNGAGRSNHAAISSGTTLSYGDPATTITETDGLKFNVTEKQSMAICFDLPTAPISGTPHTYNGGQYLWLYNNKAIITVPGLKTGDIITVGLESHKNGETRGITFNSTNSEKVDDLTAVSYTVTADGDVTIKPSGSGIHIYYIRVTHDIETVPVKTNASRNYGTMVTPAGKKLNFAAVEDDVKAYVSPGLNDGKTAISIQKVGIVPANTPIIIKTTTQGATVNVPVTDEDADDVESINKLVAGDGTTDATPGTYTYFYIASDQFHKATSGTLTSGKAYLKLETAALSRDFYGFDEGGETTGIQAVETKKLVENNKFYNLAGQRVAQPTKGLYIVNGKKVIIK